MSPRARSAAADVEVEVDTARVAYLVYRLERRLRARLVDAVRKNGATTTEYITLSVLERRDGMSCAQLARWAFVTPQAMNAVITGLEHRGLVERHPDPRHGRVRRASVTGAGLEVLAACERDMDVIEGDMLRELGVSDVGRLRSVAFSPDGALAAVGSDTGRVVVWDVDL